MPNTVPRTRSTYKGVSISEFFQAVGETVVRQQLDESAPAEEKITYVEFAPKKRLFQPDKAVRAITFKVIGSMRALVTNQGTRRDMPRVRDEKPHPSKEGYKLVTYGFWQMNLVEFEIVATSNPVANELLEWFESLMMRYTHVLKFFKARGVSYLAYEKRLEDLVDTDTGQELYTRRVQYLVRTDRLDIVEVKNLETLNLNLVSEDGEMSSLATLTSEET